MYSQQENAKKIKEDRGEMDIEEEESKEKENKMERMKRRILRKTESEEEEKEVRLLLDEDLVSERLILI